MAQLTKKDQIRQLAENDLAAFITLVHPGRVLGAVHKDLISWWQRDEALTHQLLLLPRDHGKSAMVAYRVAQEIVKNPAVRILYISATSGLAEKQLKFIKDILESKVVKFYWPELINESRFDREKWGASEISVDHPARAAENVRDPTVFTAGLTTTITGLHFDVAVMDDVVVPDNAYTEEGRDKVRAQYSQLSSIESTDARQWVVGTRYHPKDLYNDMMEISVDIYDESGDLVSTSPLYEKYERTVESQGDGTGEFLWPRQQRTDGKWFGFNQAILARKRAQYLDRTQFYAQYYNNPNAIENALISADNFQYYDRSHIRMKDGSWYFRDKKLNVFASVDFAYTLKKTSDYTCIVVVGVDSDNNYYVLDIDRFRTDKISEYFSHILRCYEKWNFRKVRCEITAAQSVIVKDLKDNYIRPYGLALSVEEYNPPRTAGSKHERVTAILQPRYDNLQIWHYQGGNTQVLEEELILRNPPHDDVKDTLASCIDMCIPPTSNRRSVATGDGPRYHTRFGGIL
jgi:hypothetical protein